MKGFLPTAQQAKRLLLIGLAAVLLSAVLREGVSGIALGVGCVLITIGFLCNGFAALLGRSESSEASRDEQAPN
ncbi:hypothetical protein [Microcoleus sp. M2_C2]|jgi:hypothetical protein|uniref:hypothetical protein n=1 Tax=unclassified Microcoleus TaxID=2642155 RepID=UPI002FD49ACF